MRSFPAVAVLILVAGCFAGRTRSHDRDLARMRVALARQQIAAREYDAAMKLLQEAQASGGRTAETLTLRATILQVRGISDEAEADLKDALRIDSGYAPAHASLAVLYDEQRRFEDADPHHKRATQLAPENASYLNDWGYALYVRGKSAEAIRVLQEAVRLDPAQRRYRNNLGFAHARAGDFTRAAEQFGRAGNKAEASNNLGFAYELAGNLPQAYDAYLAAARLDPRLARARQNLAAVARSLDRAVPAELSGTAPAEKGMP